MLSVTIPDKQNTEFSIRKNLKHNVTHTELKGQSVPSFRNKTRVVQCSIYAIPIPDKDNTELSIKTNFKHNVTHFELKGQSVSSFRNKTRVVQCSVTAIPDEENTELSMWKQDKQIFRYVTEIVILRSLHCHHYISPLS